MRIYSHMNKGYGGQLIGIEADLRNGFPGFDIVGLPDGAIRESRHRIRSALRNSGFRFPKERVLVNLVPADIPKGGAQLDLAIAVALIVATTKAYPRMDIPVMVVGELGLDGTIHPTNGTTAALASAKENGCTGFIHPHASELHIQATDIRCLAVDTLRTATTAILRYLKEFPPGYMVARPKRKPENDSGSWQDPFDGVVGLHQVRRAMEIAAAGRHNLLLFGPPGAGKTMMANRMKSLAPILDEKERDELAVIYSGVEEFPPPRSAPERLLPHDATVRSLFGNPQSEKPGEATLSHNGILLLDELPLYSAKTLDAVKQVSDGCTIISGQTGRQANRYPAKIQLVGTMNPCPCGGLGQREATCVCSLPAIRRYWAKVGTPLLDRFDIRIPVIPEESLELNFALNTGLQSSPRAEDTDSQRQERINVAAERQRSFWKSVPDIIRNGEVMKFGNTGIPAQIEGIVQQVSSMDACHGRSVRSILGICTVALTIANLNGRDYPNTEELEEAVSYQRFGLRDIYWRDI